MSLRLGNKMKRIERTAGCAESRHDGLPAAFNINLESRVQNRRTTRLEEFANLSGF